MEEQSVSDSITVHLLICPLIPPPHPTNQVPVFTGEWSPLGCWQKLDNGFYSSTLEYTGNTLLL